MFEWSTLTSEQKIILLSPLGILFSMFIVFQVFNILLGYTLAWYFGLIIYWIFWCGAFGVWMIGKEDINGIIRPQKVSISILIIIVIPIIITLIGRILGIYSYEHKHYWLLLMYISTAFGNGFFEEFLWRGVYTKHFNSNDFFRLLWSSVGFALWHYAPASIGPNRAFMLLIGAFFLGLVLSYISKRTDTIFWSIVVHTTCGLIIVI